MALDCETVAQEELKRLRDIQRLLQSLLLVISGSLDSSNLEEVL